MESSYWRGVLRAAVARRRRLAAAGAGTLVPALLAACGGGSATTERKDKSGLLTEATDSSKQARRGATLEDSRPADVQNWDINITSSNQLSFLAPLGYSRLVQPKAGYLKDPDGELVGDLAESWEWSPDRLQLTMKLRPGVVFHDLPPVNGRALDVDDLLFSWNRFASLGSRRGELFNAVNPSAPILSITAPDPRTMVFKLKEPVVYVLNYMSISGAGNPHTYPKEAENGFDVRQKVIGTGPYYLAQHVPSVGTVWK